MNVQISPEEHTHEFLKMLAPDAEGFYFRAFPDHDGSKINPSNYDGTLHQIRPLLEKVNCAGAGAFVVVNQGGQRSADITRVRAVFADTDGAPLEPLVQALKPHMVVESSPGRWHVYWLVASDFPLNQFGPVQSAIAVKFGTDGSVKDLPRVMRLPGFYHNKGKSVLTRLIKTAPTLPRYTLDEIIVGLELTLAPAQAHSGAKKGLSLVTLDAETPANVGRVRDALATLEPSMSYPAWRNIGMALRSTEWTCAKDLARDWSRGDEEYTDAAFDKLWNNIQPQGGITLGTLFGMAHAAGWEDPLRVPLASLLTDQETGVAAEERDVLNGRVFADKWRGRLMRVNQTVNVLSFDPDIGWVEAGDSVNAMRKAARETLAHMSEEAATLLKAVEIEKSQKITKHVAVCSTLPRMDAMAAVAWTHDGMTVSASDLDAEPELLGVRNGVLNLRKRSLTGFCPVSLITKRAGVEFDPGATAPQFEAFLARVQPDVAVRRLLQQIAGLTLWGKPGEQRLFFFHGGGANGKTTFVEVLMFVLGGYAVSIQAEALMRQDRSSQGPSADTMRLQGARGAFASEVREGRLDEERVKLWTGGDMLSARPMYGRSFIDFAPSHTFIMTGNHRPAIHDTSLGIWRRVTLIDWAVQIPEHEQDARLSERLRLEGSGILNWALYGLKDYWANGLVVPPSVKAATDRYKTDEDIIGQFISERCRLGGDLSCSTVDLYWAYRSWAEGNGIRVATKTTFTRRLADRGYPKGNSGREYRGIALLKATPMGL